MVNCFCTTFFPCVAYIFPLVYCWKGYFLEVTVRVLQLHMCETTVHPLFVSCRNLTGFALMLVVTYSETDSL